MKKNGKRVTIRDIAERCGVTANTVSRALRNDAGISEATTQKIRQVAGEMGYIRNNFAAAMRSGHSRLISIIVDDIQNPHYATLIYMMDELLRKNGYVTMTLCTHANPKNELVMANLSIANLVDGILYFPESNDAESASLIQKNQVPLVLIDREIRGVCADAVRLDDYQGGRIAADFLYARGHRQFAYLSGPSGNGAQPLRQKGFEDALAERGISAEAIRILDVEPVYDAMKAGKIIRSIWPVAYTGLFAFNDQLAYHVINSLREGGHRVPEDVSVIGFDHMRGALPYLSPLSSVAGAGERTLAETAVSLLLRRIGDYDAEFITEILPVMLHEAKSTVRNIED